jgi:predicted RND superfamily exporter protein
MIASVTLGIAVDDTIHFVTWYTRNMAITHDRRAAILKTFRDVGKPIVITSVVLFLGFFILILGTIKPTQAFGVLTAFSMFFALIGDIIFLPALLMFFKPAVAKGDSDFLAEHGEAGNAVS